MRLTGVTILLAVHQKTAKHASNSGFDEEDFYYPTLTFSLRHPFESTSFFFCHAFY
jgi:hypothetical protein